MEKSGISELLEKTLAVIERERGVTGLSVDTPIESLGLDSLEKVDLLQTLAEEVAPMPPLAALSGTVGQIVMMMEHDARC